MEGAPFAEWLLFAQQHADALAWVMAALPVTVLLLVEAARRLRGAAPAGAPAEPGVAPDSVAAAPPVALDGAAAAPTIEMEIPEELLREPVREPVVPVAPSEPAVVIQPEPEPEPEPEPTPKPRPLRERLARTQEALVGRLAKIVGGRSVDADLLEELEALLFTADLGVQTAEGLLDRVKSEATGADGARVREVLRSEIETRLQRVEPSGAAPGLGGAPFGATPHVVLVLGVNGSGKTTTIGKLAARYHEAGHHVVLGAGDTFRAAAIEQLQTWGERVGCEVIAGASGGDPAAVAFDTVKAAIARSADVAIIDTAGRLQTKAPLMEELSKIERVIGRDLPGAPHEVLLVLDSNTGQNALSQARLFTEAAGVTGIVLTKLDGTAKGGVIVGLADEFGIPVRYVGVGEGIEDLRDFNAREFVEALFADSSEG